MTAVFDPFAYRDFPVFAGDDDDHDHDHDDDTCFIESLR
ncbi:MAG: CFI-box putative sorting motif-containing protein [Desulfosalsimonadaceae bacterium]